MQSEEKPPRIINHKTMRKGTGAIAILMPWVVVFLSGRQWRDRRFALRPRPPADLPVRLLRRAGGGDPVAAAERGRHPARGQLAARKSGDVSTGAGARRIAVLAQGDSGSLLGAVSDVCPGVSDGVHDRAR